MKQDDFPSCDVCGGPAGRYEGRKTCSDCGVGEFPVGLEAVVKTVCDHGSAPILVTFGSEHHIGRAHVMFVRDVFTSGPGTPATGVDFVDGRSWARKTALGWHFHTPGQAPRLCEINL